MSYLCKQEWKRPTPVQTMLTQIHAVLGRVIPGGWVPVSGMTVRNMVLSVIHSVITQDSSP